MPRDPFSRWRYSTRILFSGCDQATYQQDLVIHRTAGRDHEEEAGGLRIWHIYIGPRCRPDYGDLRFTDRYGRELAYYLWPDYTDESARVCVRLTGADVAGEVIVWHGNPAATTTSDGDAVYILFDHFDGSALDTSKWNVVVSSHTVSGGVLRVTKPGSGTAGFIFSKMAISYPVIVQSRGRATSSSVMGSTPIGIKTKDTGWDYRAGTLFTSPEGYILRSRWGQGNTQDKVISGLAVTTFRTFTLDWIGTSIGVAIDGTHYGYNTQCVYTADQYVGFYGGDTVGSAVEVDWALIRTYSATPPSILRTSRGVSPAYAGLVYPRTVDSTIRFGGVGAIQVLDDEKYFVSGAGSFSVETRVSSPIPVTTVAGFDLGLRVDTPVTPEGVGSAALRPTRMLTPLAAEAGVGTPYVAPTPVQFDLTKYRFSSLTISRSAQDALWQCEGRIAGLDAPLAYKQFEVRVPDHNGVLRTIFVGFVPGRDYVRAAAADESIIQGYDAGFYLTRQYLPDGDLTYPREFGWGPARLLHYFLGEESVSVYSRSRWEQITGIMPYRLENPPSYYEWPYSSRIDWVFQPKTTKAQAIQEICEKSGLVFLVKWRKIHGVWTPCAYLVPEEDIDHPTRGLDLPDPVTFTHPDPHAMDGVRVTMRSDEKYNRIEVRSASPSGAWFHAVRETPALQSGDELPIEYLEERSDLPIDADHGGWCNARADELYAYYTKYAYTYTLTLIDRTDLELYQRCRFYGFDSIPSGEMMRIVAITYNVLPTHTEVEITVTPDSRLSDLRRLQRSQAADAVSEMQVIARSQIEGLAAGEIGTVIEIDGSEAIVELERKADSSVRGRIV
jgi:hypothetical protein